ncbi:hypothetical protein ACOMHN_002634 [Nucella lapillus]
MDGFGGNSFRRANMFENMFGGLFDFPGLGDFGGYGSRRRGHDTVQRLQVPLEDFYHGKTYRQELRRTAVCKKCRGVGGRPGASVYCQPCSGLGAKVDLVHTQSGMVQPVQTTCFNCHGEGEYFIMRDRCPACHGRKMAVEKKTLEVPVEKGMRDGQRIVFRGEGEQALTDAEPGDFIIVVQQEPHATFSRHNDNLLVAKRVGLTEALCGFSFAVRHLDGRDTVITHPPGEVVYPGMVKKVVGAGMPKYGNPFEKGDLIVQFDVNMPDNNFVTEPQLKDLEGLLGRPPAEEVPEGEDVEEVSMVEYDPSQDRRPSGYAYHEDDNRTGHPGPGVQCAHQ